VSDPLPNPEDPDPHAISLNALRKTVTILDRLAPNLEFFHLQYGTFIYGICFPDDFYFPVPLTESLPPLKEPFGSFLGYAVLRSFMEKYSADKPWKWCETRPGEVIGEWHNPTHPNGQ
jgi:hypothetical protein